MLLTLSAICLRSMLLPGRTGKIKLDLLDLPRVAREELGLHGLNMSTALLAGVGRDELERLRERADKAGCACLLLVESDAQRFGDPSEAVGAAAIDRLQRVIQAGHYLGCSCVAVKVAASGSSDGAVFQRTVERLRRAVARAEKLELNVLIAPTDGLTSQPEKVTELIKKVGGFRMGTYPDFQAAAASHDPVGYVRKLTPYAAAICASTLKFVEEKADGQAGKAAHPCAEDEEGEEVGVRHTSYDIEPLVKAIMSVGYDGTLGVEYRGTGDAKLGVIRTRELLERLMAPPSSPVVERPGIAAIMAEIEDDDGGGAAEADAEEE